MVKRPFSDGNHRESKRQRTKDEVYIFLKIYIKLREKSFLLLSFRQKDWNFQYLNQTGLGSLGQALREKGQEYVLQLNTNTVIKVNGLSKTIEIHYKRVKDFSDGRTFIFGPLTNQPTNEYLTKSIAKFVQKENSYQLLIEKFGKYLFCINFFFGALKLSFLKLTLDICHICVRMSFFKVILYITKKIQLTFILHEKKFQLNNLA